MSVPRARRNTSAMGFLNNAMQIEICTRQRRKLKKLRRLLDNGVLLPSDVYNSFQSWSSHSRRFDAWRTWET